MTEQAKRPEPLRYTPAVEACGHIIMPKMREDATGAYVHWPEHEKALARTERLEAALRARLADHEDQAEWWASIKDHENSEYHTSAAADIRKALEAK